MHHLRRWAHSQNCCKFTPGSRFPVALSLRGAHLLGGRLPIALVSDPLEALALELGELDAVGGVADVEVEHDPERARPLLSPGNRRITWCGA